MKLSEHGPGGPRDEQSLFRHDLAALAAAEPGDLVVARAWKYNGQAHYVVPGGYVGSDEHGHWIWQGSATFVSRPGLAFFAYPGALLLVPHEGDWLATFHRRVGEHSADWFIYADVSMMITADPMRVPTSVPGTYGTGVELNSFDMDLDVVRSRSKGIFIDDEKDFQEHAALFGYPRFVVERMRASADALAARMRRSEPPFDDPSATVDAWRRTAHDYFPDPMETP